MSRNSSKVVLEDELVAPPVFTVGFLFVGVVFIRGGSDWEATFTLNWSLKSGRLVEVVVVVDKVFLAIEVAVQVGIWFVGCFFVIKDFDDVIVAALLVPVIKDLEVIEEDCGNKSLGINVRGGCCFVDVDGAVVILMAARGILFIVNFGVVGCDAIDGLFTVLM